MKRNPFLLVILLLLATVLAASRLAQGPVREPPASPAPAVVGSAPPSNRPAAPTPGLRAASAPIAPAVATLAAASPPTASSQTVTGASVPSPTGTAATPRRRAWDRAFLAGLSGSLTGSPLRLELLNGERAGGSIRRIEHQNGEVTRVDGEFTTPAVGRFFFQKQSRAGKAGEFTGLAEFPSEDRAYRIEPTGPEGASELVERRMSDVLCVPLLPASTDEAEIPPLKPDNFPTVPIPPYQTGIVVLESRPGAVGVMYLDYQGGYTPTWGGITYTRPAVNNTQIRDVWKRVAEDYAPFNINVTTDLKVYQNAPEDSRQRVIITPTTTAAPGAGGVAYIGSWNWDGDTPCWVFMTTGKSSAEAISHEVGHTLGLGHDGKTDGTEYYGGQGSGATGWAPIMGVGYYQQVSQWSKGEYTGANQTQDDLAIIVANNNSVDYRVDDTTASLPGARHLELYFGGSAKAEGIIERTGDIDAYQFTTTGGLVSLRADPVGDWGNVAMSVSLYDEADTLLVTQNPQTTLGAALSTTVPAGTYTFRVRGMGRNNALTDGFSAYGSLGYYAVSGTLAGGRLPTRFTVSELATNDTLVGLITVSNPDSDPLTYSITSGNTAGAFALDNTGQLTVANSAALDYETLARDTQLTVQFELFVDIVNEVHPERTELARRVVVAVPNVNEPPVASDLALDVLEHTSTGTRIGTVQGTDPDFYTLLAWSIVGGDTNGLFTIDPQSGDVRVAGDLDAATQSTHVLEIRVSDQTAPLPLTATSTVTIRVLPNHTPFKPGAIQYAVYTNITGLAISELTASTRFPYDPSFEKALPSFEGDRDRGDTYGAVMRGYLLPPVTGSYTFWIATDDSGELWLSQSTNPATLSRIASLSSWANPLEWTKYASQRSTPQLISLVAGQAYYIEARMKEQDGGDHMAVAWECAAAGIDREVIPGRFLAPYSPNYTPRLTAFTASLHRDARTGSRIGSLNLTDVNSTDTHTCTFVMGNSAGLFAVDNDGIIRVADAAGLAATPTTSFSLLMRATDSGIPARTATATATVRLVAPEVVTATKVQQEMFTGITGNAVSDLTANAKYPRRPDSLRTLDTFNSGENVAENYGSRIRALLTPPATGSYRFFIASDDASSLRLSTSTNPVAATQIAYVSGSTDYQNWTQNASQASAARNLVAGQRYYIETLHKEGAGGDHVSVAWTGPGLTGTNVITSAYLTPVDMNSAPTFLARTVQLPVTATSGTLVATLTAQDSPLDSLAFTIDSGNTDGAFALDPDTGALTVANAAALAAAESDTFTLAAAVQDTGYGDLYPRKTALATVTIQILGLPRFALTRDGANLSLGLTSLAGHDYVLERATNLAAPTLWAPVSTNVGTGGWLNIETPVETPEPQVFLRLMVR